MFRKGTVGWIYGADDGHFSQACFRKRGREKEREREKACVRFYSVC